VVAVFIFFVVDPICTPVAVFDFLVVDPKGAPVVAGLLLLEVVVVVVVVVVVDAWDEGTTFWYVTAVHCPFEKKGVVSTG
jgi:hypothetical protein